MCGKTGKLKNRSERLYVIIVKLFGGLGNQMFQYAAGRRLANLHNTDLKFDFQGLNYKIKRNYALSIFNINEKFATSREIGNLKFKRRNLLKKIVAKIFNIPPKHSLAHIKEKYFNFDPEILNQPNEVYLSGYWQSEKYFKDIEEIIRNEFTIKYPQTGKNKDFAKQINSCESVSIHIRRGDYISDAEVNQYHGICELDYYYSCIKQMTQKIDKPIFFVFSDEPAWTRENFRIDYPTVIIEHNSPENAYEDLRLMSQCKHNIIANSSFSWWGAWLNSNPYKIIFSPRIWFANTDRCDYDLVPKNWTKV